MRLFWISARAENPSPVCETGLEISARVEIQPGLKFSPCNRKRLFKKICSGGRGEISAWAEIRHVDLRPRETQTPPYREKSFTLRKIFGMARINIVRVPKNVVRIDCLHVLHSAVSTTAIKFWYGKIKFWYEFWAQFLVSVLRNHRMVRMRHVLFKHGGGKYPVSTSS